jgi:hypothetical protein
MRLSLAPLNEGWLVKKLRPRNVQQGWIQIALAAAALFILESFTEPWKPLPARTWLEWGWDVDFTIFFSVLTFGLAALDRAYTESETLQVKSLQKELALTLSQRNTWIETAQVVRELIRSKQSRLLDVKGDKGRLLSEFKNSEQPVLILKSIHDQFKQGFRGTRIRVSVFGKVAATGPAIGFPYLRPLFSFDGRKTNFLKVQPEHFRLDSDSENRAEVVKHFAAADHTFRIIEDCWSEPTFTHFQAEERHLLRSMLLFKHRMEAVDSSIVLAIDCDVPGYFNRAMKDDYEAFVVEMMHCLENKLLVLQVVNDTFTN